jgi:hypothetical protein
MKRPRFDAVRAALLAEYAPPPVRRTDPPHSPAATCVLARADLKPPITRLTNLHAITPRPSALAELSLMVADRSVNSTS